MRKTLSTTTLTLFMLSAMLGCSSKKNTAQNTGTEANAAGEAGKIKLITLDPGHFHAALVQKSMYPNVDPQVHVFAPEGEDLQEHLKKIEGYNTRAEAPTKWEEKVYTGPDYLQQMLDAKPGNVVVLAGDNQKKIDYIQASVKAGLNVLADKPMAIDAAGFEKLKEAFATAEKNKVLLYDIMTERYEITTMLQREFSQVPEVFGTLQKGTPENPAITKESVHHFFKFVSGSPLKRPSWFFDVSKQGEGVVDVTTHLVDLVQWECFPEQTIDYQRDIKISNARHWKTNLTPAQFRQVTQKPAYPENLRSQVGKDSTLGVYSNGEINYQIKGVNAKVSVIWNFQAPEGTGDTHFSMMKGTKANLVIRQGKEQNYKPLLYIEPAAGADLAAFESSLTSGLARVQQKFPGIELKKSGKVWTVVAPEKYHNGHEAHFGQVAEKYLSFLAAGKLPAWEVPNMLAKYYTTTKALEMARQKNQ